LLHAKALRNLPRHHRKVPALIADGGLPVGVQVIARYGADAEALAAARFVEEALKG
jgi:Asp-tRNA(Asn)/Glu-tRNA(Gln) amidotransferase A subunit family amidase